MKRQWFFCFKWMLRLLPSPMQPSQFKSPKLNPSAVKPYKLSFTKLCNLTVISKIKILLPLSQATLHNRSNFLTLKLQLPDGRAVESWEPCTNEFSFSPRKNRGSQFAMTFAGSYSSVLLFYPVILSFSVFTFSFPRAFMAILSMSSPPLAIKRRQ